jgi:FtsH-binding integral membrane protein
MVFVGFGISGVPLTRTAWDLLTFLSPIAILRYLLFGVVDENYRFDALAEGLDQLQWFYSPVGTNIASGLVLSLLVCGTGTYWMWQGWQRRFPNPTATVLSKRQSYLLVICCQVIILGFALQSDPQPYANLMALPIFNLAIFLGLIAALTSERQSLYDWARYRKQIVPSNQKLWRRYPLLDLIWSDKSPAVVAIAINLLISVIILTPWALLEKNEINEFWRVICCLNLILIYAAITQLFLFTKTRNQEIWAVGTVGGAILLPPVILCMLFGTPENAPIFWVSSMFGIGFSPLLTDASGDTILPSILNQWTVLVLLNLKLRSQLKLAGESASKALLKA